MNIKIRRVYELRDKDDGMRILVDRLWPRGLTKEKASVDLWMKEIAPATVITVRNFKTASRRTLTVAPLVSLNQSSERQI